MPVYSNNNKLLYLSVISYGFNMRDTKEQLENSIKFVQHRLKKFDKKELLTEEGNNVYNRLLIKKAVMTKKLADLDKNKIKNLVGKIYRKISNKKLICDNF